MTGMPVLFMILCASIDFIQCLPKDEQSCLFIPSRAEMFLCDLDSSALCRRSFHNFSYKFSDTMNNSEKNIARDGELEIL